MLGEIIIDHVDTIDELIHLDIILSNAIDHLQSFIPLQYRAWVLIMHADEVGARDGIDELLILFSSHF